MQFVRARDDRVGATVGIQLVRMEPRSTWENDKRYINYTLYLAQSTKNSFKCELYWMVGKYTTMTVREIYFHYNQYYQSKYINNKEFFRTCHILEVISGVPKGSILVWLLIFISVKFFFLYHLVIVFHLMPLSLPRQPKTFSCSIKLPEVPLNETKLAVFTS